MRASKSLKFPSDLAGVERQFAKWRRTRKLGTRIPQRLWASAVKLATTHGLHPTTSALRLDYYSLKKRVERAAADSVPQRMPPFVEATSPVLASSRECVIELENAAGSRMRIHVKGGDPPDLIALGRSFWSAG